MIFRFIGVPRALVNEAIGEMEGWHHLGEKILHQAIEDCPEGAEGEDYQGPHLKATLELSKITGADPRLLIGSKKKGAVLGFVNDGTDAHEVVPVNAQALRFTSGGTVVFAQHASIPAHDPNPFIMRAVQKVVGKD